MNRYKASNFSELLTVLFIGLKLTGHINWSWFWVLSPIWFAFIWLLLMPKDNNEN